MVKVIINNCYGGFGISIEAYEWLINERGWTVTEYDESGNHRNPEADICVHKDNFCGDYSLAKKNRYDEGIRTDQDLIDCIETLGVKVNNHYSKLKIVEVPDNVEWTIEEYDGNEWVAEKHRTWT